MLEAFCDHFVRRGTGAKLHHLGFTKPHEFYKATNGAVSIPSSTTRYFSRVCQMSDSSSEELIQKSMMQARVFFPNHSSTAYAGVGRIDGDGRVAGNAKAWKKLAEERYGGLDEICWYVGNLGAYKQLLVGHAKHPALAHLIPEIHESSRR